MLVQIIATGLWPYAFAYQLQSSLEAVLEAVMPRHPVKTVHVLCPACTDYAIDLQLARAAAGASMDVSCAASRKRCGPFGVAGFRCWDHGISDESERRGFLAAALEKAREDINYVTHALDVMRRYMLCYCVFAVASAGERWRGCCTNYRS